MITPNNFKEVLRLLGFTPTQQPYIWSKTYGDLDCTLSADLAKNVPEYPTKILSDSDTTRSFKELESYVVFVCVAMLLDKGYRPEHIYLERTWTLGHTQKSGRADITVFDESGEKALLIIECKRAGKAYLQARKDLFENAEGKQLFSYQAQARACRWLQLFAADYDADTDKIVISEEIVKSHDDKNVETLALKDNSILLYRDASEAPDIFRVWDETYNKKTYKGLIFGKDTTAYKIGVRPLKKHDLREFNKEDGIANNFEEILRHNSISDKENAFNKLLSLFICKLVDEKEHGEDDVVDFQYKEGTDDYFSLYERLLRLFHRGMDKFLKEDVFYLEDSYISDTLSQFTGKKRKYLEEELRRSFQRTKLLSCQVFAFREIYNEKLFMQNGKVLVEMVELFQGYRLSYSSRQQFLGELFEQLLNKGFKQDQGQFFTPIPITRFIWNSLPFERFVKYDTNTYPKVIDYACGAGHFLTEGISAISDYIEPWENNIPEEERNTDEKISRYFYGVEKDNRLARVSKIALLLNGANDANIKAMDGLAHDVSFLGEKNSFDILVANPPYSVDFFKLHLERKLLSEFDLLQYMTASCDDIENVFVERINQLLKPNGIAAVILPDSILSAEDTSTIKAREIILKNFFIHCITSFGKKTFGETPTSTVVLFMEKRPVNPDRSITLRDCAEAIFSDEDLSEWEDKDVFEAYLQTIEVSIEQYNPFRFKSAAFEELASCPYFKQYVDTFNRDTSVVNLKESQQFKALTFADQEMLLREKFYEQFISLEKEKIYYFALTYQQDVLLINPPSETKAQKQFLGYDYSTRKRNEGLYETEGLLTSRSDRNDQSKMAWLVKDSFSGKYDSVEALEEYTDFTNLSSLLDFKRERFYKTIKSSVLEEIKSKYPFEGLYDEDYFDLSIGDRVLNTELVEGGKVPVYSANVREIFGYVDNLNRDSFDKPSVLWGIDGDWLVNYIPENTPFYPTDHCGVLRLNSREFNAYYVSMILNLVGKTHKFSRSYRASIDRVKGIRIPKPPIDIQEKIAKACETIEEEYRTSRMTMEDYRLKITQIFENLDVILGGG